MLEQYVLGELPEKQRRQIEQCISHDSALQKQMEAIRQSNSEILAKLPPDRMVREIELKAHTRNVNKILSRRTAANSWWHLTSYKPAFVTVMTLLLLIGLIPFIVTQYRNTQPVELTRIKGLVPLITVYRSIQDSSERLGNLSVVNKGDIIQIGYIAADKKYGVIVSVDGRGAVTLHYPASDTETTLLKNDGEVLLGNAYELDDAPLFEQFFFITADEPVVIETVRNACKTLVTQLKTGDTDSLPDLPAQWKQYSIVLRKGNS